MTVLDASRSRPLPSRVFAMELDAAVRRAESFIRYVENSGISLSGAPFFSGHAALEQFGHAAINFNIVPATQSASMLRLADIRNAKEYAARLINAAPPINAPYGPEVAAGFVQVVFEQGNDMGEPEKIKEGFDLIQKAYTEQEANSQSNETDVSLNLSDRLNRVMIMGALRRELDSANPRVQQMEHRRLMMKAIPGSTQAAKTIAAIRMLY